MFKKLTAVILAVIICTSSAIPTAATSVASKASSAVRSYILSNIADGETWEQRVLLAAVGVRTESMTVDLSSVTEDDDTLEIAQKIITALTTNADINKNALSILASKQLGDGSFGHIRATLASVIALTATGTTFSSEKAVKYLLSCQTPDGNFNSNPADSSISPLEETCRVMTVLAYFKADINVANALDSAAKWLLTQKNENDTYGGGSSVEMAYVLTAVSDIGLSASKGDFANLLTKFLEFERKDYAFVLKYDAENIKPEDLEPDNGATLIAYMALDAAERGSGSVYLRLMNDGSLTKVHPEDIRSLIITYAIIGGASVIFWVIILVKRPKKEEKSA